MASLRWLAATTFTGIGIYSLTIFGQATNTPCPAHAGVARLDEGSGMCTGNYQTIIDLPTVRAALIHDSLDPNIDVGFGKGFRLSTDRWFVKSGEKGVLYTGTGLSVDYAKSSNGYWYPKNFTESKNSLVFSGSGAAEEMRETSPQAVTYRFRKFSGDSSGAFWLTDSINPIGDKISFARETSGNISGVLFNDAMSPKIEMRTVSGGKKIFDLSGKEFGLTHNTSGRLVRVSYPDGRATTIEYVGDFVKSIKYPGNQTIALTYMQANSGRIRTITTPEPKVITFAYTDTTVKATNANGGTQEKFDRNGRIIELTQNGQTLTWRRDGQGRIEKFIDEFGASTLYSYTANSSSPLVASVTYPDLTIDRYEYASFGYLSRKVTQVNGITMTNEYLYNSHFLPTQVSEPGGVTHFEYDGATQSHLIRTIGPNGQTIYSAEWVGKKLLAETDAFGLRTKYDYDGSNNFITRVEFPNGKAMSLDYDVLGRVRKTVMGKVAGTQFVASGATNTYTYPDGSLTATRQVSMSKGGSVVLTTTNSINTDGTSLIQSERKVNSIAVDIERSTYSKNGVLTKRSQVQ